MGCQLEENEKNMTSDRKQNALSPSYLQAIQFASKNHATQYRKLGGEPFILHPISVAAILADYQFPKELIIAAILHDVVEDTPVTLQDVEKTFGKEVATLVDGVSEQDKSLPWEERKKAYFDRLQKASLDVIRLSAADKLHNLQDLVHYYKIHGDSIFEKFNAGKEKTLAKYQRLIDFYTSKGIPWSQELHTLLKEIR